MPYISNVIFLSSARILNVHINKIIEIFNINSLHHAYMPYSDARLMTLMDFRNSINRKIRTKIFYTSRRMHMKTMTYISKTTCTVSTGGLTYLFITMLILSKLIFIQSNNYKKERISIFSQSHLIYLMINNNRSNGKSLIIATLLYRGELK